MRVDLDHLCGQVVTPASMAAVLDSLVHEKQLRRVQANHILDTLLAHVDAHGGWRGDNLPPAPRQTVHPPDVRHFAETGLS